MVDEESKRNAVSKKRGGKGGSEKDPAVHSQKIEHVEFHHSRILENK